MDFLWFQIIGLGGRKNLFEMVGKQEMKRIGGIDGFASTFFTLFILYVL